MGNKTMVLLQGNRLLEELNSGDTSPVSEKISRSDNLLELVGLVFLLIVILVAAYYTSKFIGKIKLGQLKNSNFKVIDAYRLSPSKVIQIVKIGKRYFALAICKDRITVISELQESELEFKDDLEMKKTEMGNQLNHESFKKIFDKLKKSKE